MPQNSLARQANLHFLTLVNVPSIPLYLAAGPSFDVSTANAATASWLEYTFLPNQNCDSRHDASREPGWFSTGTQSDLGILLEVVQDEVPKDGQRIVTEILLYAAIEVSCRSLPTPPRSSSPAASNEPSDSVFDGPGIIKVYALPLSSAIINDANHLARAVTPPIENPSELVQARFLPDHCDPTVVQETSHQKRQSLSSLFDDATQKRRKLKSRGGESVAQAMAKIDRPPLQNGFSFETQHESQEQPSKPTAAVRSRRGLTRAQSMSSAVTSEYSRPTSRSGALASGKRSSLHRMESALSTCDNPTFPDLDNSYSEQNKAALTKVIMAGMRLYGLQQKKKKHEDVFTANSAPTNPNHQDSEDEYKIVYHQTFKAASFALRRQSSIQLIPQENMRDIVDRLLDLFCTDPFTSAVCEDGHGSSFGTQVSDSASAFDLSGIKKASPSRTLIHRMPGLTN